MADGTLRYANNSNYKNDVIIRKEGLFLWIVLLFSEGISCCNGGSEAHCD